VAGLQTSVCFGVASGMWINILERQQKHNTMTNSSNQHVTPFALSFVPLCLSLSLSLALHLSLSLHLSLAFLLSLSRFCVNHAGVEDCGDSASTPVSTSLPANTHPASAWHTTDVTPIPCVVCPALPCGAGTGTGTRSNPVQATRRPPAQVTELRVVPKSGGMGQMTHAKEAQEWATKHP